MNFILICLLLITAIGTASFGETVKEAPQAENAVLLTLSFEGQQKTYTLDELENLESYSGNGGRINAIGNIQGPFVYIGVRITKLAQEFQNVPSDYELLTVSRDGYVYKFTNSQIKGNIQVYDTNGNEVGIGGVTMLLAYKEDGVSYFYGGPLRIAWINDDTPITDAPYWPKYVDDIEIVRQTNDNFPPEICINDPNNGLYLNNRKLVKTPFTIILGGITIDAWANDAESGIKKVMFFIDGELKAKIATPPYKWFWDETAFGLHTISVSTFDAAGNIASYDEEVWIINP